MKLKAVVRRVIIEIDAVEKVTKGGIHLPNQHTESEQRGEYKATVVSVGDLAFRDLFHHSGMEYEPVVKAGDRVLFKSYSGTMVSEDEEDRIRVINDADILAIIEEE